MKHTYFDEIEMGNEIFKKLQQNPVDQQKFTFPFRFSTRFLVVTRNVAPIQWANIPMKMINTGYAHCDPDCLQFTCDSPFASIRGEGVEKRIIGDVHSCI